MSIATLITGKLIADPERRTSSAGKPFTKFRLVADDGDGGVFVSGVAFGSLAEQVAALGKGDAIAVTGRARPTAWLKDGEPKAGLDVVADQLLTPYHLKRKRAAMAGEPAAGDRGRAPARSTSTRLAAPEPEFPEDEAWLRGEA